MNTSITFTRNLFRHIGRGALVAALAFAAGCGDDDGGSGGGSGNPDAGSVDGPSGPNALERSLDFMGGAQALESLDGFSYVADGTRFIVNEGPNPGDAVQSGTFTATVSHDLANGNLRLDYTRAIRALVNADLTYNEVFTPEGGYVVGDDSIFPGPENAPMFSSRWASGRRQQLYLNPQVFLRAVAADVTLAEVVANETVDGTAYGVFEVEDEVSKIRCFVAEDGTLAMIKTTVNDFLVRDIELTVKYDDWQEVDGYQFPATVELIYGEDIIHQETRTEIAVNPTFAADFFAFPAGDDPVLDATLEARGETTLQFYQSLSAIGIPLDFAAETLVAGEEIADGIWHITGPSHNSLLIEQENGLVLVEAPNYPERSEAILAYLATEFPDQAVTHVIATHHHEDHSAGLRTFVAAGATIVVHSASEQFFRDVFSRPSTIVPDALAAETNVEAVIETVTADTPFLIDDAARPVEVFALQTSHANDMVLTAVASGDTEVVFESDLYNPGNGGVALNLAYAAELLAAIQLSAPGADVVAGGHGAFAPLAELTEYVANNPAP